jgi:uncharacterized membrane protein
MSGTAWELVDLVARWVHVIASIMWVGNSLLFNWLDRNLSTPAGATQTSKPVGNIWLLHSGGFYYVEKTLLEGQQMPRPMHWFKWQAYSTWISGFVLLIVVYWAGGRAVMADPSVSPLSEHSAMLIGIAAVFGGWALYESMNRFVAPRWPAVSAAAWIGGLIAIAIWLTQILSGRAAFLHVGAMMGTIMAGNVVFTIVPSQRALVKSVEEGVSANLKALSARAKRVSIHNNYFTFPVIVLMVSNHFPAVYGSRLSWVLLLILIAGGAAVRHVLNIRWTFAAWRPALWATMFATVALLIAVIRAGLAMDSSSANGGSSATSGAASNAPVTFADVRHIIDRRCTECHSATPTDPVYTTAPNGVKFDTPEQIYAWVPRIKERAVVTRTMPLGNKTQITDAERELLGRWIAQGASR